MGRSRENVYQGNSLWFVQTDRHKVLRPHCKCRPIHGSQSSPIGPVSQCGPFAKYCRNRRSNRSCHTRLRTVESDLTPLDIGLTTASHQAQNRQAWAARLYIEMAAFITGQATRWWWLDDDVCRSEQFTKSCSDGHFLRTWPHIANYTINQIRWCNAGPSSHMSRCVELRTVQVPSPTSEGEIDN